ncbi:hypothetical protein PR202_ga12639 [Eleusine coracana subsp. coracana]|uniref:Sodium/metabolite cotransporter BASS1, chloroplastic n=1 Tax=Eleusine coracana subsp. coracana TaxID=191504 RepID=A0AAV5CCP5_ELECO|nr:hypothetical protein PR202_ga12639 [Eleusine coracana subsp. coracana]
MPLTVLQHAPPAPTAAGTLSRGRRHVLSLHRPFKVHSSPRPLAYPGLRPAVPLRPYLGTGISSRGCRAATDAASSEVPEGGGGDGTVRGLIVRVGEALSLGFPVWVASACALALWRPPAFLWVGSTARMVGLSFTMLGMGMTLTLDDLKTALLMPKELAVGFLLQYTFMTPLLTSKLAGQYVAVDPVGLFISTSQVVLAPVLLGALLNQYCNGLVHLVSPLMPFIAVATVAVLCGNAIAQNASAILASGVQVVLSVGCLHASGFFFGYVLSRILGIDTASSRTISIEVGMQNSVLGVVLASKHFGNPLTAVPCAVSSVCHSVYGDATVRISYKQATETTIHPFCCWTDLSVMLPWRHSKQHCDLFGEFMTPLLTSKLAGQYVAVDPVGLFISTSQVVLAPVLLGALLNQYCNGLVHLVSPLMPFIAVATVAVLCGNAIAQNASAILASASSRTISIEVGMQNSVLGVVLASKHFGNPLTAVPCAVSSVCHSVYGSIVAGIWRSMPLRDKGE